MKKLFSMFVRAIATVIMAFLLIGNSRAQDSRLVTYKEFEKEGYKDQKGDIVIPAVYDIAYPFGYAGLAKVRKYGKWGVVDQTGKEVISCNYEDFQFHLMV